MSQSATGVAYINIEADNLLRTCFAELGAQEEYRGALELILRGTLPREVLSNIERNSIFSDPKNLSHRFSTQKHIHIDSWSELLNLASITCFYNVTGALSTHFVCSIGLESAYRESSLREKYLGDGAIASSELGSRQIVQSCLAQNIRGQSAGGSLQDEVIKRLQAKLSSSPDEPTRILAVTIISETEDFRKLNFEVIAQETIGQYKDKTTYGPVFCVIPSSSDDKPQIVVVPLADFLPGGITTAAVIKSEFFMENT